MGQSWSYLSEEECRYSGVAGETILWTSKKKANFTLPSTVIFQHPGSMRQTSWHMALTLWRKQYTLLLMEAGGQSRYGPIPSLPVLSGSTMYIILSADWIDETRIWRAKLYRQTIIQWMNRPMKPVIIPFHKIPCGDTITSTTWRNISSIGWKPLKDIKHHLRNRQQIMEKAHANFIRSNDNTRI